MIRLFALLVLLCLGLFCGCASSKTGLLDVATPSSSDEYVVQIDSVVKIVKGTCNRISLDTGKHFVKVSYAGQTIADTIVHASGRSPAALFQAWMAGSVVGAGVMTFLWSNVWLVVVPVAVGISTFFTTSPEKIFLKTEKRIDGLGGLHPVDDFYLRVWNFHSDLGISEKYGVTNVMKTKNLCYDRDAKIVWVQSEVSSRVYPLNLRKDAEACQFDFDGNRLLCSSEKNSVLQKYPCHR